MTSVLSCGLSHTANPAISFTVLGMTRVFKLVYSIEPLHILVTVSGIVNVLHSGNTLYNIVLSVLYIIPSSIL